MSRERNVAAELTTRTGGTMHITRANISLGEATTADQWGGDDYPTELTTSKFEAVATYRVTLTADATQVQTRELESISLRVDRLGDDGEREQSSLTLHPEEFYKLVDLLGAVGHHGEQPKPAADASGVEPPGNVNVVDLEQNENVTTWKCHGCGGGGGIAGQGDGSPDDRDAVDHFWEEVRSHELGECQPPAPRPVNDVVLKQDEVSRSWSCHGCGESGAMFTRDHRLCRDEDAADRSYDENVRSHQRGDCLPHLNKGPSDR